MASNYTRRISLYINGKEVTNDIASIKGEMNKLIGTQARMTIGSKEYVKAGEDIKKLKGIISEHTASLRPVPSLYDKIKGSVAGGYTALLGYAASVMAVAYSFKKLYDAAEEQRVADRRLLFALNGNIDAFQQLNEQASELQMQTGIEDSVISQIQMLGVQSGKSVKDVKKITHAAIELSSVTGDDLQTSFMQLNKTFTGALGKSLPRLSTDFSDLTKEQLKNGEAIDLVLAKYSGMAAESATEVAKMTQAFGEFQEALGNGETGPVNWLIKKMTSLLGVMKDVTEVFFSFGGNRNAWEAQKEGVQSTAISVANFQKEMEKAQKDETRWNNIKKNGIESLNKSLTSQQQLLNATKSKIDNSHVAMRNDGMGAITSKEMNDLKVKQQYEQAGVNTIRSKISVLYQMINPLKKSNDAEEDAKDKTEALKDAFQELSKQISDLDKQINNAIVSGNSPLVKKLSAEKKAAELLLKTFNEVKTAYGNGWDMDQRDQGSIDTLVGIGANVVKGEKDSNPVLQKRNAGLEVDIAEEKEQAKQDQVKQEEAFAKQMKENTTEAAFQTAAELNDSIFSIVKNRQQAELNHKLSMLEKQRQAELSNKDLTEAQKLAINEKYDKQTSELKAKQFKRDQNAAIIQALINGALAITRTFSEWGFPLGVPMAVAQGVATGLQIAVIKSQKVPEFSEGGFTVQDKSNKKVAGVVHANEYVIPAQGVSNPKLAPFINMIEVARQNGNLPTLNTKSIIKSLGNGFFEGGYTSTKKSINQGILSENASSFSELVANNNAVMNALLNKLKEPPLPIEATVAIRGRNGLYEKLEEDKQSQKNASL